MPDSNRPSDFGDRFRDHIHDEINARFEERMARHRAKMERRMERWERRRTRHSPLGGVLIGMILAGVGVLLLLQNLGFTIIDEIFDWWPVILIALGAARVLTAFGWGGRIWGSVLMFAGGVFLASNFGYIHGNPWNFFWPVILIAIGVGMLARAIDGPRGFAWVPPRPATPTGETSANTLAEWAVFGGIRRRVESQDFEGGEALAAFGGINLDLTKAAIQKEEVHLEANAFFGGIDIQVPETWNIVVRGSGIFGGYEDKTWHAATTPEQRKPRLVISGFAVFGGVSVKT